MAQLERLRPVDVAMGVTVALVWGLGIVFAKAAIAHFPPILLMALRFAVTALALVWFVRPPFGLMTKLCAIAFVSAAIQYSLTFTGLAGIDASTAVLVVQLEVPFLVLLGALALGERTSVRRWIGIAIAFCGVALIAGEPRVFGALGSVGLVVGGAFAWAVGQVMVRRLGEVGGFTLIAWVAVFATPQLLVMSALFERGQIAALAGAGWLVWATVVYLGLVMTALGYGLWYSLIGRHPVSRVGPFLLLLPVFSVAGAVALLDERLTLVTALGGALIVAGLAFILVAPRTRPTAAGGPA